MNKTVKPFFARFLEVEENQELRAKTDVKAGADNTNPTWATKKYPSDDDETMASSGFDSDSRY